MQIKVWENGVNRNATDQEIVEITNAASEYENKTPEREAKRIRFLRNAEILKSDWTQVADAPVDQTAWATYRQALRDIPEQDGFPLNVIWPDEP